MKTMWFLVAMDLSLANWDGSSPAEGQVLEVIGEPVLSGLYGPFDSPEAAEAYRAVVAEPGTRLAVAQATDPASYPPSADELGLLT